MTTDDKTLTEQIARALRRATDDGADRTEDYAAAVLPIIARVRRDAAREAIDGLIADKAHMAALLHAENGGNVEDVLTHYSDTHYPEETP